MTSRADLARLLAVGLCALAWLIRATAASAQAQPAAPQAQSQSPASPAATPAVAWSAAHLPDQPVYQDHYIGGGTLAPDISAGDTAPAAMARASRAPCKSTRSRACSRRSGAGIDSNTVEDGIVAKAQWETAQYGAWSLDASARTQSSDAGPAEQGQGGVFTLRQRGMPFDGGWQADNALGDLNAPDIEPRAGAAALLSAHRSHAGRDDGMARAGRPADRRRRRRAGSL